MRKSEEIQETSTENTLIQLLKSNPNTGHSPLSLSLKKKAETLVECRLVRWIIDQWDLNKYR